MDNQSLKLAAHALRVAIHKSVSCHRLLHSNSELAETFQEQTVYNLEVLTRKVQFELNLFNPFN